MRHHCFVCSSFFSIDMKLFPSVELFVICTHLFSLKNYEEAYSCERFLTVTMAMVFRCLNLSAKGSICLASFPHATAV